MIFQTFTWKSILDLLVLSQYILSKRKMVSLNSEMISYCWVVLKVESISISCDFFSLIHNVFRSFGSKVFVQSEPIWRYENILNECFQRLILFLTFFRTHGRRSGTYTKPCEISKMGFQSFKTFLQSCNYFRKMLHLRCLTGFFTARKVSVFAEFLYSVLSRIPIENGEIRCALMWKEWSFMFYQPSLNADFWKVHRFFGFSRF